MTLAQPIRFFSLSVLFAFLAGSPALAAKAQPDGRKIYRQLCVKCHGRSGEGVKGKYDDPLQGDWALEKLTRYIDKKMPDDAPEKCVGPDAAAVARYIHDAFYSREARERNHPARIELVHLTNRQYLHTVADLIKHFTGDDPSAGSERGLKAVYYNSRDFKKDDEITNRIDRSVNFDFGASNPFPERIGTNGFSMQWRGSVLADETGDYEFVVKTPNGARLWLNDDDQPLIDAWVASGNLTEHRASIRLLGGRIYSLRLDYFKFKDKTASISLFWKPPHGAFGPVPPRNLTPVRSTPTLVIATPFPPDDSSVGYERGVAVSKAWDEATTHAAIEVAGYVVRNLDRLSKCKIADSNRTAQVEAFCTDLVQTAFRRPLDKEQKRIFVKAHLKSAPKLEDAVKRVVLLTLKSPRFLYLGLEGKRGDDFDVAARLSFDLWDSLPDGELVRAAEQGKLHEKSEVSEQARRMLGNPRARAKMQAFLHHWLQMDRVEDLFKDATLYPGFTPEMVADLRTSLNVFLEDTVWNGSSDYRSLLSANYLFVNDRLAKFYGLNAEAGDDFVKVSLDGTERSGILTHPYLLSAFSYPRSTSPIHRGVFLTRNIVGRALKPPPMAMSFKESDFDPNLTMREKVAKLTQPQACQSCHSVINPLGFSLEKFDAVGRFRTRENDRPIDVSSEYVTDDGETIRLGGARDVANFAIQSEQGQNAFIEQLFHQMVKQPVLAYGSGVPSRLRQEFVSSEFNLQQLLVNIATTAALPDVGRIASARQ